MQYSLPPFSHGVGGCPGLRPQWWTAQPRHGTLTAGVVWRHVSLMTTRAPWSTSNRRAELPPHWRRLVRLILKRDPTCTACWASPSAEVDHVGDRHDHRPENLQGLCTPCHRAKTQRQAAAGRAARGLRRTRPAEAHPGVIPRCR